MGSLRALNLLEDLRGVLELMDAEERESLRCQIPDSTADSLVEWLHGHLVRTPHSRSLKFTASTLDMNMRQHTMCCHVVRKYMFIYTSFIYRKSIFPLARNLFSVIVESMLCVGLCLLEVFSMLTIFFQT